VFKRLIESATAAASFRTSIQPLRRIIKPSDSVPLSDGFQINTLETRYKYFITQKNPTRLFDEQISEQSFCLQVQALRVC